MKVGFVVEPYEESGASGMGYVAIEFVKNMLQLSHDEFVLYSSKPIKKEFIPGEYVNKLMPKSFAKKFLWFFFGKHQLDAVIYITPLLPLIFPSRIKTVLICQELYTKEISSTSFTGSLFEFIRDRIFMPITLRRASKIVVPSDATKKEMMHMYAVADEKIIVIPDGFQDISRYQTQTAGIPELDSPFFFFAGRVKPRKNVHAIVDGFIDFMLRTKANCKLVIAGGYGGEYYQHIEDALHKAQLRDKVLFIGYVTGPQLYSYYKNTLALVYPSLHEGFGMPIVEAMSIGTPVITSNISSMPEVAGDAALLVNPYNANEIGEAMEKIYDDETLRGELEQKGIKRAKMFSWQHSAKQCLELLHSL